MAHFVAKFVEQNKSFVSDFGAVMVLPDAEVYSGSYEVTPKVSSQVVQTADKFMKNDMTILAIPYYDVGNTAGGSTVYIGNEV